MKVSVYTLGCKVNQYESGAIVKKLKEKNYEVVGEDEKCDVYIINTCAVTNEAERKSRQVVSKFSRQNPCAKIVVCGCSSQNDVNKFLGDNRLIIGTANKGQIVEELEQNGVLKSNLPTLYEDDLVCEKTRVRAYIKVQDGCDNFCSYCIVPYLRGRSRSREIKSILKEIDDLCCVANEFVITGINLSDYGKNIDTSLTDLVFALKNIDKRIRLGSLEVNVIDDSFLLALKQLKNFCPHFHLSLQSGSNSVLKKMNRHYTKEQYFEKAQLIRKYFPDCSITTDVIIGFPTETDAEHEECVEFIKKVGFSDMHVFVYSEREGTKAAKMEKVDGERIKHRKQIMQELKKQLANKFLAELIGKNAQMLSEQIEGDFFVGHAKNYAKCYIPKNECNENEIIEVACVKVFKDGLLVKKSNAR